MWSVILLFCTGYLAFVFPLAYFRGDDWLILGNAALQLPQDWKFLWRPTLFYSGNEVVWFFRPFFKLGTYLFYKAFGYHYYSWLVALLALCVAGLYFAALTAFRLTGSRSRSYLFLALFCTAIPFHMGSLAWMGEGMMNCPQLFLLALSCYLFVEAHLKTGKIEKRSLLELGSLFAFIISLGFKESSVFQPGLLVCLLWKSPSFDYLSLRKKVRAATPHLAIALAFLVFRLRMEFHPGYEPGKHILFFIKPLAMLAALPAGITILYGWLSRKTFTVSKSALIALWKQGWPYLGFMAVVVAPYLGHGFFSLGWMLLPGFYFCFLVAIVAPGFEGWATQERRFLVGSTLAISLLPVLFVMNQIAWPEWQSSEQRIKTIFDSLSSEDVKQIVVYGCTNPKYPEAPFKRVIGFEAGLYNLWAMGHDTRVPVKVWGCLPKEAIHPSNEDTLTLRWEFPDWEMIHVPGQHFALLGRR